MGLFFETIMKSNLFIADYFRHQGCLNIEQGVNLWHLLNQVLLLGIPGDVVELGSLTGMTASVIQRTLDHHGSDKLLYLFDNFDGLPREFSPEDGNCPLKPENFRVDPKHIVDRFATLGLRQPFIIKGWFRDTLEDGLPRLISFAHLDGDLYQSTMESLEAVYLRLAPGAVVLVDDYADPDLCVKIGQSYEDNPYNRNLTRKYKPIDWLPGVRVACDEFLANKPEEMTVLIAGEE